MGIVPVFLGSAEFGQGFHSIPIWHTNHTEKDTIFHALIKVVTGHVTCRQIESALKGWVGSESTWRFYAKPLNETEFLVRFPTERMLAQACYFPRLTMSHDEHAAITIQRWTGDIQPKASLEAAWFRVRGIPMKYRVKEFFYGVDNLVGKVKAIDKNSLSNHGFVRINIACRDISLVPAVKEGELEDGLYDFEFTREIPDGVQGGEKSQHIVASGADGTNNSHTPKRQRTDPNSSTNTQSVMPRDGGLGGSSGQQHGASSSQQHDGSTCSTLVPYCYSASGKARVDTHTTTLETVVEELNEEEDELSLEDKVKMLGYGDPGQGSSSNIQHIFPVRYSAPNIFPVRYSHGGDSLLGSSTPTYG